MGQGSSLPSYHEAVPKSPNRERYVVISKEPPSPLSFNPSESYLVSYGIDLQTSPNYSDNTLPSAVVDGTRQVMDAFVNTGTIPKSNAFLYAASKDLKQCKISGMKDSFQECAKKVGQNGLFVFLFSGHGIKFRQRNEWTLVPADFDSTQDKTHLSPEVLGQWLAEVNCRAIHTLFILDCCYAGGVATTLTEFADLPVKGSFSVLSACTANQSSFIIAPLGHSSFTFFLSRFISTLCMSGMHQPDSVKFPLKIIFNECQICSRALSSLMIATSTTDLDSIMIKVTEPQLAVVYPKPGAPDKGARNNRIEADTCEVITGFQYAYELYDPSGPVLEDQTKKTIYTWQLPGGPLRELNERHLLTGQLLNAALCIMMYSVAAVELSHRDGRKKVTNVNLSITAFIQVATVLNEIVTDLAIPKNFFFQSWLFYLKALDTNGVSISEFEPVVRKFMSNEEYFPSEMRSNLSDSVNRSASANKRVCD